MNPSEVHKKVAERLAKEEPLSAAECKALIGELSPALGFVNSRIAEIQPTQQRQGANGSVVEAGGALRMKVLRFGTAEEVADLDREYKKLKIAQQQLRSQVDPISQRLEVAMDEEAAARIPELHKQLNARTEEALTAAQQFKEALSRTALALQEIESSYGRLRMAYQVKGVLYPRVPGTEDQYQKLMVLANAANGSLCPPAFHPRATFFLRGSLGMVDDRDHLDKGKPGYFVEAAA